MIAAIMVAAAVTVIFAGCGPWLARTLAPTTAVRLLVPTTVVVAGGGVFVLAVVAFIGAAQLGEVAEVGRWSAAIVHTLSPVSDTVATIAGLLLAPAAGWAGAYLLRTVRAIRDAQRACHGLHHGEPIVVVDSNRADAFTTPGLHGQIVVTTALLHALDERQQQALLAHERSQLRHRHPWWTITADLATSGQIPARVHALLRPPPRPSRTGRADPGPRRDDDHRDAGGTAQHGNPLRDRRTPRRRDQSTRRASCVTG